LQLSTEAGWLDSLSIPVAPEHSVTEENNTESFEPLVFNWIADPKSDRHCVTLRFVDRAVIALSE
jgi:hypothetical protein